MTTARRIQRRRVKGWRMPPGTIYVGRPTRWANPFNWREGVEMNGEAWAKGCAIDLFNEWRRHPDRFPECPPPPTDDEIRAALRGHDLACWCAPGEPCHADVYLRIANR